MEALILIAEHDGPMTMFARIGVMWALNHSKPAPEDRAAPQAREGIQHRPMKELV
jgi:hypothetical protein